MQKTCWALPWGRVLASALAQGNAWNKGVSWDHKRPDGRLEIGSRPAKSWPCGGLRARIKSGLDWDQGALRLLILFMPSGSSGAAGCGEGAASPLTFGKGARPL